MITRIVERGRTLFVTFDILVFTSLIWFMVQFLRFVFPPLFETIQGDYGVSNTEVGLMFSALLFAYSCMQFPAGYLSDVFNERVVITAGTVVFGLGSLLVVLSDPFWTLLVGVGLIGLGTGTHKTVAVNLLSRLYPSKTGLSIGVMDTIGQAGGVFAPAVVVRSGVRDRDRLAGDLPRRGRRLVWRWRTDSTAAFSGRCRRRTPPNGGEKTALPTRTDVPGRTSTSSVTTTSPHSSPFRRFTRFRGSV